MPEHQLLTHTHLVEDVDALMGVMGAVAHCSLETPHGSSVAGERARTITSPVLHLAFPPHGLPKLRAEDVESGLWVEN